MSKKTNNWGRIAEFLKKTSFLLIELYLLIHLIFAIYALITRDFDHIV